MIRIAFILLLLLVSGCTSSLPEYSAEECAVESVVLADSCWRDNHHMSFGTCLGLAHQATGSCYIVEKNTK